MKYLNMVGPQIRKLRYVRGWSQNLLATKLQLLGWNIDRVAVAKIESRLVHVDDYELLYFTRVFNVGFADLFPKIDAQRRILEVVTELMQRRPLPGASPKRVVMLATTVRLQRTWSG
jgi:transcriptional regulator with XRE-family HTH domain